MNFAMPLDEKKSLLIKAFFEGSVVVIDEFNSAPMMERFLNALLMGKIPDDPAIKKEIIAYGKTNPKPGFMLVATQNPAEMGGRGKESPAMLHRMQKIVVGNNSKLEIVEILEHKGLPKEIAEAMAAEYVDLREKNKNAICFRDLIKRAEDEIIVIQKKNMPTQEVSSVEIQPQTIVSPPNTHSEVVSAHAITTQSSTTPMNSFQKYKTDFVEIKSPEKSGLAIFKEKHKEFFDADKQKFGGWFRKTRVKNDDPEWDLKKIIEHAKNDDNRSRRVCVALEWMNKDGTLNINNEKVPVDVQNAFHEIENSRSKPKG